MIYDQYTNYIWFSVANWEGVDKVLTAMEAQLSKLATEEAKTTAAHANQKGAMTTAERTRATIDSTKTRDWLTRDPLQTMARNPPLECCQPLGTTS